MERVGDYLKRKREEKNITIEQITRITKIQPYMISALEQNDVDHLPHHTFVKGFVKNYCHALKIPPEKALLLFDEEIAIKKRTDSEKEIETLQKRKETSMIHRRFSFSPIVIMVLFLFVFIILFFTIKIAGSSRHLEIAQTQEKAVNFNFQQKGAFTKIYKSNKLDASKQ